MNQLKHLQESSYFKQLFDAQKALENQYKNLDPIMEYHKRNAQIMNQMVQQVVSPFSQLFQSFNSCVSQYQKSTFIERFNQFKTEEGETFRRLTDVASQIQSSLDPVISQFNQQQKVLESVFSFQKHIQKTLMPEMLMFVEMLRDSDIKRYLNDEDNSNMEQIFEESAQLNKDFSDIPPDIEKEGSKSLLFQINAFIKKYNHIMSLIALIKAFTPCEPQTTNKTMVFESIVNIDICEMCKHNDLSLAPKDTKILREPTEESTIIMILNAATIVKIIKTSNQWCQIKFAMDNSKEIVGWCLKEMLLSHGYFNDSND